MKTSPGFTVTELLVLFVFFGVIGAVVFGQYQTLASMHRDQDRKIAVNAMYYNLQEVAKPKLGGYPRTIKANSLNAMNPALLKDPQGLRVGDPKSDYRYEPTGCNGGDVCTGFTIKTALEREGDFVRSSL